MAAKNNEDATEIDRSTFDWIGKGGISTTIFPNYEGVVTKMKVPPCGACHPGSGGMEYARDPATGQAYSPLVRLDEVADAEISALDGDFFSPGLNAVGAPVNLFTKTGVIEADCLLCHMTDYSFGARFKQITLRNYKWAATAGAKLGSVGPPAGEAAVEGAFYYYPDAGNAAAWKSGTWNWSASPTVTYKPKAVAVDVDGTLTLNLSGDQILRTPTSLVCRRCHAGSDSKKRGFSWTADSDVHMAAGKECLDCHGMAGDPLNHNIGKGHAPLGSVRQDLDGTIENDCQDCHGTYLDDNHAEIFGGPMHLNKIACQTCHIPYKQGNNIGYLIDMSSGNQVWMLRDGRTPAWAGDFAKIDPEMKWRPFIKKYDPDGAGPMAEKYYPYGSKTSTWFGYVPTGKTTIQPYILKAVNGVYNVLTEPVDPNAPDEPRLIAPKVPVTFVDGTTGMKANVSAEADIILMLKGLLALDSDGPTPVFVSAEGSLELDGAGTGLVAAAYANAETDHNFAIFHNIRPADEALGAGGCTDCHSAEGSLMVEQITDVSGFLSTRDIAANGVLDEAAIHANGENMLEFAGFSESEIELLTDEAPSSETTPEGSSSSGCFIQTLEFGK